VVLRGSGIGRQPQEEKDRGELINGVRRPEIFHGENGANMTQTVWQCEQLRAGQVYSKTVFNTKEEAEEFMAKLKRVEPDIFWRLEPVEARMIWN
jgi:hypothetical protein